MMTKSMTSLNLVQKNWLQGCLQRLSKGHLLDNILQAQEKKAVHFAGVGKTQGGKAYADSLRVNHYGNTYVIEVVNPVEYASYVEFGHRTRNHEGWVEGKFMLTISEQEVQGDAAKILENKLKRKLGEVFR